MSAAQKVAEGLAELEAMDRAALATQWHAEMKRPPPKASSRVFLLRALSYELQAKHEPGLSTAELKTLRTALIHSSGSGHEPLGRDPYSRKTDKVPTRHRITPVPGSRLVREWNGQTYTVSVIEEGFVFKDRVWSSLSAIAKDITGAHWSGPRFFGLNKATN